MVTTFNKLLVQVWVNKNKAPKHYGIFVAEKNCCNYIQMTIKAFKITFYKKYIAFE